MTNSLSRLVKNNTEAQRYGASNVYGPPISIYIRTIPYAGKAIEEHRQNQP